MREEDWKEERERRGTSEEKSTKRGNKAGAGWVLRADTPSWAWGLRPWSSGKHDAARLGLWEPTADIIDDGYRYLCLHSVHQQLLSISTFEVQVQRVRRARQAALMHFWLSATLYLWKVAESRNSSFHN